jgi:hypothetical protein
MPQFTVPVTIKLTDEYEAEIVVEAENFVGAIAQAQGQLDEISDFDEHYDRTDGSRKYVFGEVKEKED